MYHTPTCSHTPTYNLVIHLHLNTPNYTPTCSHTPTYSLVIYLHLNTPNYTPTPQYIQLYTYTHYTELYIYTHAGVQYSEVSSTSHQAGSHKGKECLLQHKGHKKLSFYNILLQTSKLNVQTKHMTFTLLRAHCTARKILQNC